MEEVKEIKEDRRVRKTRHAVHKAMLELLREKTLPEITVLELTERADINRKTFYNHYADLMAVLDEIENLKVEHMMDMLRKNLMAVGEKDFLTLEEVEDHIREIAMPFFRTWLEELTGDKDYYHVMLHCGNYSRLREKIVEQETELFLELYGDQIMHRNWLEYFFRFIVDGSFAVYRDWAESGKPESIEELAGFFTMMFTTGSVKRFLEKAQM